MPILPVLLLAALAQPPSAAVQDASHPRAPNVLVIVMDDVSERDIDRIETPRFDALASVGMRFRRAYAAPVCSPNRRAP